MDTQFLGHDPANSGLTATGHTYEDDHLIQVFRPLLLKSIISISIFPAKIAERISLFRVKMPKFRATSLISQP